MDFRLRTISIFVGVIALVCAGVSFAHAHEDDQEISENEATTIHITEDGYEPQIVDVLQGQSVIFLNEDAREHWPASNIHPTHSAYPGSDISKCGTDERERIFDACRGLKQGEHYEFIFTRVGSWRFHDHNYPDLVGEINVLQNDDFVSQEDGSLPQEPHIVSRVWRWLVEVLRDVFYSIFPGKLDEKIATISIFEIANQEDELHEVLRLAGVERVMVRLLDEADGGSTIDCHQPAHQVGRAAFTIFGSEIFEKGDASCHSGFYHGAMESFLAQEGTDNLPSTITDLCAAFPTFFGEFECLHGVGHGVMAYEDYNLPVALEVCKTLSSDFARSSCYGGVFMENIIAAQGAGATPGHETIWTSKDPHFPCNTLEEGSEQEFQCYQMQTSLMLQLAQYDFATVAQQCSVAPVSARKACFISLGRDSAGFTLRDPKATIENCSYAPRNDDSYKWCIVGGLNVVIDFWGPKLQSQGEEFCAAVPEQDMREICLGQHEARKVDVFGVKPV